MKTSDLKYITAKEAVGYIKNGDRVAIGHACGEPRALTIAMCENMENYCDVETTHLIGMAESSYCHPDAQGHFRHNSLFPGAGERKAVNEGRADFTPSYFHQVPSLYTNGSLPLDVALVQVSVPDQHGYVSFGVSVDYTMRAAQAAKLVIAQVNESMPRCLGDCFMHISEIDYFVREDMPLVETTPNKIGDTEKEIGKHCATLIPDGATLQLGIGTLPDAVLSCLTDKKDLGIHTELLSDGVMHMYNAGVITGKRKSLLKGKIVTTFIMGSKALYDFADNNPGVYLAPVDYVNDPYVIAQNDNMVSINSCVQVDLTGQVCAESVGLRQISSVGGQVDFIRGCNMSKGGVPIIAMNSTTKDGKTSKIVSVLDEGAAVTTGKNDVGYIVTEYGIADLRGKSVRERARLLINIAHPDFRAELTEEWERRFNMSFSG